MVVRDARGHLRKALDVFERVVGPGDGSYAHRRAVGPAAVGFGMRGRAPAQKLGAVARVRILLHGRAHLVDDGPASAFFVVTVREHRPRHRQGQYRVVRGHAAFDKKRKVDRLGLGEFKPRADRVAGGDGQKRMGKRRDGAGHERS